MNPTKTNTTVIILGQNSPQRLKSTRLIYIYVACDLAWPGHCLIDSATAFIYHLQPQMFSLLWMEAVSFAHSRGIVRLCWVIGLDRLSILLMIYFKLVDSQTIISYPYQISVNMKLHIFKICVWSRTGYVRFVIFHRRSLYSLFGLFYMYTNSPRALYGVFVK